MRLTHKQNRKSEHALTMSVFGVVAEGMGTWACESFLCNFVSSVNGLCAVRHIRAQSSPK